MQATVWENPSDRGAFRTVSLNKSYRKDGEWKNTGSLGENDIDRAISVLEQASDYLNGAEEEAPDVAGEAKTGEEIVA